MKKPTTKKSILMELPAEEVVEEVVEEVLDEPKPLNEGDIFKVEPIQNEKPIQNEEIKVVKSKKPRSLAQQEALAKGRQKRLDRIYAEKQNQRDNTPQQAPRQTPQQTPRPPPPPAQLPVNNNNNNNNNNDFESFLNNYEKFQRFERLVLEKNKPKQVQVAPTQKHVQPQPQVKQQVQPATLDYAFNLNRTSRRRGGFY